MSKLILLLCLICIGTLAALTAFSAVAEALHYWNLPDYLVSIERQLPHLFPIHMIAGALALIFILPTLMSRPGCFWHRVCGRLTAIAVIVAGTTSLIVVFYSHSPLLARIAFAVQGLLWLGLLGAGLKALYQQRIDAHRRYMMMMAAMTISPVVFRVMLATTYFLDPSSDFETIYQSVAWAAWILPLGAVACIIAFQRILNSIRLAREI